MAREVIIKPASSSGLKVFHREVRADDRGEYVLHQGMHAYIIRKDGRAYIDYWMSKSDAAKTVAQ